MHVPDAVYSIPPAVLEHALLGRDFRAAAEFDCWKALATHVGHASFGVAEAISSF
jgi:hypothetical protein